MPYQDGRQEGAGVFIELRSALANCYSAVREMQCKRPPPAWVREWLCTARVEIDRSCDESRPKRGGVRARNQTAPCTICARVQRVWRQRSGEASQGNRLRALGFGLRPSALVLALAA